MSNRFYTTYIDSGEYIGESLIKINDSFNSLDTQMQVSSAVSNTILNLSLSAVINAATALTSFNALNDTLKRSGVFYVPFNIYVDPTNGSDFTKSVGDPTTPCRTLSAAFVYLRQLANPAVASILSATQIDYKYNIILQTPGVYPIDSQVVLADMPGCVNIIGNTMGAFVSGTSLQRNTGGGLNNVHQYSVTYNSAIIPTASKLKIFHTRGKEAGIIPGHAFISTGSTIVTGCNVPNFTTILSGTTDPAVDPYIRNYFLINNEVKQLKRIISDTQFEVTTPFNTTASGVPIVLGDLTNYYGAVGFVGSTTNREYALSGYPGPLNDYNDNTLYFYSSSNQSPITYGNTLNNPANFISPGDILFYNNTAATVLSTSPIADVLKLGWTFTVNTTGTYLTDSWRSKTSNQALSANTTRLPFFIKRNHQLQRGVYDVVTDGTASSVASLSSYNLCSTLALTLTGGNAVAYQLSSVPVTMPLYVKDNFYGYTLPTTIVFTSTATDGGFNISNSRVNFSNVNITGKNLGIGILGTQRSYISIDGSSAITNFYNGIQINRSSTLEVLGGDLSLSAIGTAPVLVVSDNTGYGVIAGSFSNIFGSNIITSRNQLDGLRLANCSNVNLNAFESYHNGGYGINLINQSHFRTANINVVGNYYGINIASASTFFVEVPTRTIYNYTFTPGVYHNSILPTNGIGINIDNSTAIVNNINIGDNGYRYPYSFVPNFTTPIVAMQGIGTGTFNNIAIYNNNDNAGIYGSKTQTVITNSTVLDCATGIYVPNSGHIDATGITIRNCKAGIAVDDAGVAHLTSPSYPYTNNFIQNCEVGIYTDGNFTNVNSRGDIADFKLSAVAVSQPSVNSYSIHTTNRSLFTALSTGSYPAPNGPFNAFDTKTVALSYLEALPS